MERDARTVFAINPGSTSTKIAVFDGLSERFSVNISHSADDLRPFERVIDQAVFRVERINCALRGAGIEPSAFCGVVGRGGLLRPLPSGVYRVNHAMLDTLRAAPFGEHASNLGAIIARHHADESGCEAYIVDPVVVDEMDALARFTGFPGVGRRSLFHALNQKSAAREVAAMLGRRYEECRLIVAHLGGGISVGAHVEGRVIDVNNALDGDGPFSPERAGGLPSGALVDMCFESGLTRSEIRRRLAGSAGLVAHCGTNSFSEVKLAMAAGDRTATMAFEAMAYQVSKEIAMHGATLEGRVDRTVLTGGLAHDKEFVERIARRVRFLAPIEVIPGEREMQSLASGLLDVLEGRRAPMEYTAWDRANCSRRTGVPERECEMSTMTIPSGLAIEVFEGGDIQRRFALAGNEFGPAKVARVFNETDGRTWGFVVVDNLVRGPGLGGTRMAPDVTVSEVYGLASAMTLKNAAAMLPIGGGKSALVVDPRLFHNRPEEKRRLIELFAEAIWPLAEYVPGPDMGTDERDMQTIYESFARLNGAANHGRGGVGRPPDKGGLPIDEWGLTAHGLLAAARTVEESLQGFRIEGARVVVQGYGNVGSHIASKLHALGARVVGASDIHCALYDPRGLDVSEMNRVRREECGLRCYAGEVERRFSPAELDELLWVPCDILIPAARPNAIGPHNCDKVDARVILQGANNPVDGETERRLRRRGIVNLTDFIVNAGGVIACAVERKMDLDADYRKRVMAMDGIGREYLEELVYRIVSENVREIEGRLASASGGDLTWRDVALDLARSRLRGEGMRVIDDLA